ERERGDDVVRIVAPRDHSRPAVDQHVEATTRVVVAGISCGEHGARQRSPQFDRVVTHQPGAIAALAQDSLVDHGHPTRVAHAEFRRAPAPARAGVAARVPMRAARFASVIRAAAIPPEYVRLVTVSPSASAWGCYESGPDAVSASNTFVLRRKTA